MNYEEKTFRYCKVRDVKSPNRAHASDAGIDFYFPSGITANELREKVSTIKSCLDFVEEDGKVVAITIPPHNSVLIPSGIKVNVPFGWMLQFNNKSGVASKKGLLVGSSIVDCGYTGECHINLHNVTNYPQTINAGDKLVQGILVPVSSAMPEEVKDENALYGDSKSERGEGGFGSTGMS